jgi:hypothetical protein
MTGADLDAALQLRLDLEDDLDAAMRQRAIGVLPLRDPLNLRHFTQFDILRLKRALFPVAPLGS